MGAVAQAWCEVSKQSNANPSGKTQGPSLAGLGPFSTPPRCCTPPTLTSPYTPPFGARGAATAAGGSERQRRRDRRWGDMRPTVSSFPSPLILRR